MSLRNHMLTYLSGHEGEQYCAQCISAKFDLNLHFVYEYVRQLAWLPAAGFKSAIGSCAGCQKTRICVSKQKT